MSNFVALGIIFLSALAFSSLQLNLGCLLLLYHSSIGKHVTKKTQSLVTGYLLGIGFFLILSLFAGCFLIVSINKVSLELWEVSALSGALIATSLLVWLVYYRFGGATELWLPRSITNFLSSRAKSTNNQIESFSLGFMSCLAELPFSILLFLVSSNAILFLPETFGLIMMIVFVLIAILPLLLLRIFTRQGNTIVSIQRWRTKNKTFLRILSGALFLTLGIFIFVFEIMGGL